MKKESITGIYGLFDTENGSCLYIGQSVDIEERYKNHLKNLRNKTHKQKEFSVWFHERDTRSDSIELRILSVCIDDDLVKNQLEILWFNEMKPRFFGKKPSGKEKWKQSIETRKKIAKGWKRNNPNEEAKCSFCQQTFIKDHLNQVYCTKLCRRKANFFKENSQKVGQHLCKRCKQNIEDLGLKNYCSFACQYNYSKEMTPTAIKNLYKKGYSLSEIAEKFGCSKITVRNYLLKMNVKLRGHSANSKRRTQK